MNILIVEDERIILDEMSAYAHEYDDQGLIQAFDNPRAAMAASRLQSFDIALLDIQMPEMTGLELASYLGNDCPWMKIIFVTAYNCYAAEAFDLEAVDYLLKPVRKERLFKTLDKLARQGSDQRKPIAKPEHKLWPTIQVFGRLAVMQGPNVIKWKRQKSAELFAYLLTNANHPVSKYRICDDLWPDVDLEKALVNLQTAIYQLRKTLSPFSRDDIKIEYINQDYRMVLGPCSFDAAEFENEYDLAFQTKATAATSDAHLAAACRLYQDNYLAQEGWLWVLPRQRKLEYKFRRVLVALIDLSLARGEKTRVADYLARLNLLMDDEAIDIRGYQAMHSSLLEY